MSESEVSCNLSRAPTMLLYEAHCSHADAGHMGILGAGHIHMSAPDGWFQAIEP